MDPRAEWTPFKGCNEVRAQSLSDHLNFFTIPDNSEITPAALPDAPKFADVPVRNGCDKIGIKDESNGGRAGIQKSAAEI